MHGILLSENQVTNQILARLTGKRNRITKALIAETGKIVDMLEIVAAFICYYIHGGKQNQIPEQSLFEMANILLGDRQTVDCPDRNGLERRELDRQFAPFDSLALGTVKCYRSWCHIKINFAVLRFHKELATGSADAEARPEHPRFHLRDAGVE